MAKLTILQSEQNLRQSSTPTTTALNLPLSLATQQGAAINSVVKAIGDIQNDLTKIETQNAVDKAKPSILQSILKSYETSSKLNSTDAALKSFFENTNPNKFETILKNQKPLAKDY